MKKEDLVNKLKNGIKGIDRQEVKFLIIKELSKIVLIPVFFMLIHPLIGEICIAWYGLEEYLKHNVLRLFVDSYYIRNAPAYVNAIEQYFSEMSENSYNSYLWFIPYVISMIYIYIAYLLAHKVVDRKGIGATKMLNYYYFFFIFSISNILARIDIFSHYTIFWWYIIYKILKISVLKIEEKIKQRGEDNV